MKISGLALGQRNILRPACIFIAGMAAVACEMAFMGWSWASGLLAVVLTLMGCLLLLEVGRHVRGMKDQTDSVRQAAAQAERHYIEVLTRMLNLIEVRDTFAAGRCERIGNLCEKIARAMSLPGEMCEQMNLAGRLHDIGLIAVPEKVLNKQSRVGSGEFRELQKHCESSFELLLPLESLAPVLPAIRYHHERMNGTGYPWGLRGEAIPLGARILAVADSYDAMTHDRPHRSAMTPLDAMGELRRCTPEGYDQACVDALAEVVNLKAMLGPVRIARESMGVPAGATVVATA